LICDRVRCTRFCTHPTIPSLRIQRRHGVTVRGVADVAVPLRHFHRRARAPSQQARDNRKRHAALKQARDALWRKSWTRQLTCGHGPPAGDG